MYFSTAPSSEKDQGSMNLASKTAPVPANDAVEGCCQPTDQTGCLTRPWTFLMTSPVLRSYHSPVQFFGRRPEPDDGVGGQIFRVGLASFLPPKAEEGAFSLAHDDPGVGAADEETSIELNVNCFDRRALLSPCRMLPTAQAGIDPFWIIADDPKGIKRILWSVITREQIRGARGLLGWSQIAT